eukprot:5839881-Karenia_brevis.AAC.1
MDRIKSKFCQHRSASMDGVIEQENGLPVVRLNNKIRQLKSGSHEMCVLQEQTYRSKWRNIVFPILSPTIPWKWGWGEG